MLDERRQPGWCKPRARKVTITEIIDSCGNSSCSDDDDVRGDSPTSADEEGAVDVVSATTDDIFGELDGILQVSLRRKNANLCK